MKVDYYFSPDDMPDTEERARWAADIGYDGLFTSETKHDPFLAAMAANRGAPDLDVGTAIAVAFGRSPMTVAYTAWDLATLTKGKFLLGLGTQIKPHIVRRFNMPWSSPANRLREYIEALRAIWSAWQEQTKLSFKGDFYEFTLMTPFFDPGPIEYPDVPIYIAGVGEYLSRVAGEVTDGFHAHAFHTKRYLQEVVQPNIAAGAAAAGRDPSAVEMVITSFLITGHNEEEIANCELATKLQIAFYASTPNYRGVLELHGWDEIGPELTAMSKRGDWLGMGALISDEMLEEMAVRAPLLELGAALKAKYEGVADRLGLYVPELPGQGPVVEPTDEEWAQIIASVRA